MMLGIRCSSCGAPTPIALSDEAVTCVHCSARGPLPSEAHASLVAARSVLGTLDVRHRQLTETEQRALTWEGRLRGCFVFVFGAIAFMMSFAIALFVLAVFVGESGFSVFTGFWLFLPFLVTLVLFVASARIYLHRLGRARDALERACAAVPPANPGEPAGCHLCGAPLAAYGSAVVARCGYCSADNLVAPAVLARATRDEALVLDQFEASVRREAEIGSRSALKGIMLLPVFALFAVITVCLFWSLAVWAAVQVEDDPPADLGLVWIDVPEGRCIMGHAIEPTPSPMAYWAHVPGARYPIPTPASPVTSQDLEGRPIVHLGNDLIPREDLVVEKVYVTPVFPGSIYLRTRTADGGSVRIEAVSGLCQPRE